MVAQNDSTSCDLRGAKEEIRNRLAKNKALVLEPSLLFLPGSVREGISRFDKDTRKLPLDWPVYRDLESVESEQPQRQSTLALAAADLYDPQLRSYPALQRLLKKHEFPFTTFLTEDEIGSLSPSELVCAGKSPPDWRACEGRIPQNASLQKLRNRIVLIGEESLKDAHDTPIGRVPGVVLQANYIESLLDDRYLLPSPWLLQLAMTLLGLVLIDVIVDWFAEGKTFFERWRVLIALEAIFRFFLGLLLAMACFSIVDFLIYDLAIVQFGYYPVLAGPASLD